MSINELLNYRSNIYSQNGEDGIISEILKRLNLDQKKYWCVEFGAWDGMHLSNTFALVQRNNWNAVYIEGDKKKYNDLLCTARKYKNITTVNKFVESDKNHKNSLDNILSRTLLPVDYDLLSIDIDSYDLAILNEYKGKPKIIVIEINSSIPPGILQWHNGKNFIGNSFSSTLLVAKDKGYTLVCHTGNMIFVRNDMLSKLALDKEAIKHPERLFSDKWINCREKSFLTKLTRKFKNL
ncbi:hypothetical protein OAZ97_00685 [Prochlorococcus sp. AH-736-E15]|nr:hypothetical protein [Prochlorococcus sp. AH-736-E15]